MRPACGPRPHLTTDLVMAAAKLATELPVVLTRRADPRSGLSVVWGRIQAGHAANVIPQHARLIGTVRTLKQEVAQNAEKRIHAVCAGVAATFGAAIEVDYDANYPVTFNHADETVFAGDVAAGIAGDGNVRRDMPPLMGGEDFSYMLNARPGAFIFIGNGDSAGLHHPAYDFDDEAIAHGVSYWVRLAETALAA